MLVLASILMIASALVLFLAFLRINSERKIDKERQENFTKSFHCAIEELEESASQDSWGRE